MIAVECQCWGGLQAKLYEWIVLHYYWFMPRQLPIMGLSNAAAMT